MGVMGKNSLIVAGSGRSGTTWVLDVLAEANALRPVFEPLNPFGIKEALPFANRYIKEEAEEPELKLFLDRAFSGELNYLWPNTRFLPDTLQPSLSKITSWDYNYTLLSRYKKMVKRYYCYKRKKALRPIVKFIRANLMLDWIAVNFDARIIFVVRHPGAVVASKMAASQKKGGGKIWDFHGPNEQRILSQYRDDEQLEKDYLGKYFDIFSEKLSPVSGHALLWCIENILPMYNQQKNKRYVFFYEDLVMNPGKEFSRMSKILGIGKEPQRKIIEMPSQQASVEMESNQCHTDQLSRWMKSFNNEQLDEIERILKFFNLAAYTTQEPLPVNRIQNTW